MSSHFSSRFLTFSSLLCLLLLNFHRADCEHNHLRPPSVSPPRISPILTPAVQFTPEVQQSSPFLASSISIEELLLTSGEQETDAHGGPAKDHKLGRKPKTLDLDDRIPDISLDSTNFQSPARVLILHPIYAGSHEVVLRELGLELVRRGHFVTQLRWKSDHSPIDVKRQTAREDSYTPGLNSTIGLEEINSYRNSTNSMKIITVSPDNSNLR